MIFIKYFFIIKNVNFNSSMYHTSMQEYIKVVYYTMWLGQVDACALSVFFFKYVFHLFSLCHVMHCEYIKIIYI